MVEEGSRIYRPKLAYLIWGVDMSLLSLTLYSKLYTFLYFAERCIIISQLNEAFPRLNFLENGSSSRVTQCNMRCWTGTQRLPTANQLLVDHKLSAR